MNGKISVNSKPHMGSEFKVSIFNIQATTQSPSVEIQDSANIKQLEIKKSKILIVDDNENNRMLLFEFLNHPKIQLFEAINGKQALELAAKEMPDLIFMDLKMPVMNGQIALNKMKNNDLLKSIPVVAISASPPNFNTNSSIKEQFDGFIHKPVKLAEVTASLSQFLEIKGNNNQVQELEKTHKKLGSSLQRISTDLLSEIEQQFLSRCNEVLDNQLIDEIESFSLDLHQFSITTKNHELKKFCSELNESINNYQIDIVLFLLLEFKKKVKSPIKQN